MSRGVVSLERLRPEAVRQVEVLTGSDGFFGAHQTLDVATKRQPARKGNLQKTGDYGRAAALVQRTCHPGRAVAAMQQRTANDPFTAAAEPEACFPARDGGHGLISVKNRALL
jgi:hypothetical protein